jgi:hypothetical protein
VHVIRGFCGLSVASQIRVGDVGASCGTDGGGAGAPQAAISAASASRRADLTDP